MRGRRIPAKVKRPKPIELKFGKWGFWAFLFVLVSPALIVGYNGVNTALMNSHYIRLGKAVNCDRPSFEYFAYCNALWDGPACTLEGRSRMMKFYEPIDYACAQLEPEKAFVFPVYEAEVIEVASAEKP